MLGNSVRVHVPQLTTGRREQAEGVGTQQDTLFGLAVQLLTVPSLLPVLDKRANVVDRLLLSLRDMVDHSAALQRNFTGQLCS